MKKQSGSAHIVIVIILVVALLGSLGFIFWQNFILKEPSAATHETSKTNQAGDKNEPVKKCQSDETELAASGVFCSEVFGVRFNVPNEFKGKLKLAENESVYPTLYTDAGSSPIGQTERVVSANYSHGEYDYSLKVSLYPQIDAMTLGLAGGSEFKATEKKVVSTASGTDYPEYNFVNSDSGTKVYRGTYGDVGYMLYTDAVVTKNKVVKIELKSSPAKSVSGLPETNPLINDKDVYTSLKLL